MLCGALPDGYTVFIVNAGQHGARVDDIADIARADGIQNLFAALAEFASDSGTDAMLP